MNVNHVGKKHGKITKYLTAAVVGAFAVSIFYVAFVYLTKLYWHEKQWDYMMTPWEETVSHFKNIYWKVERFLFNGNRLFDKKSSVHQSSFCTVRDLHTVAVGCSPEPKDTDDSLGPVTVFQWNQTIICLNQRYDIFR